MLLLVGDGRAHGSIWWIRRDTQLSVGRRSTDLLIEGDHSVSRHHADINVVDGALFVTDAGSKFGVHINGRRIASNTPSLAKTGDSVEFGAQGSRFTVQQSKVAMCLAKMSAEAAAEAAGNAEALGVPITDLDSCSHVVMPAAGATRTLLRALVLGRHVVGPEFLQDVAGLPANLEVPVGLDSSGIQEFVDRLKFLPKSRAPPQTADCAVKLDAAILQPDLHRQSLFANKVFVFADCSQHDQLQALLSSAGGSSVMLKDDPGQIARLLKEYPSAVCLVCPRELNTDAESRVLGAAQAARLRPIPESEIGLAILTVSVSEYTNPVFVVAESDGEEDRGDEFEAKDVDRLVILETPPRTATATSAGIGGADNTVHISSSATGASRRRRAAPRISNFWSSMVASTPAPQDEDGMAFQPKEESMDEDGSLHGAESGDMSPSDSQHPDHNGSVSNTGPMPASSSKSDQPLPPAIEPGSSAHQAKTRITTIMVPLIVSKYQQPGASLSASSADVPNFKRFKKTVHLYQ
ncbi:hypothetical protein GGI07_003734 [Coemansia sp. Benny D115]|nr:hypothetical protein GGI07_003734 [Coemansia sp. Benny D115]